MNEKRTDIGVVIGRFQLHKLHSEHIKLIEHVLSNHDKVILFLGTSSAIGTQRNPLDFITRKCMIEEIFGTRISSILPLPDNKSNTVWSMQIDTKVKEVFSMGSVTLYGSKDSFIPYYDGIFPTKELEPEIYVSATDIRKDISRRVLSSSDFRAGIIYSVYNQYPITHPTVDIIIRKEDQILLGRKPTQDEWRFIGGFVDNIDENEIFSCKRECREETGLEVSDFKFVTSCKIEDWRYRNVKERGIMTHLYECHYTFGAPQPNDDICELKWFDYNKLCSNYEKIMVIEHQKLFKEYIEWKH